MKLIKDVDKQLTLPSKDFELTEKDLSEWLDDGVDDLGANRKGDLAEYYAVTWLWDQGYEVFQNSGCTGPIDMIAMTKQGDITLIDVKTLQIDHRNNSKVRVQYTNNRTPTQKALGVIFLLYNPDTRKLRFADHGKYS